MQEINRAAALLGPKVQECNTRDKQELGAPCLLDQTIRLLSSQTVCSLAGRTMLRALGYPHLHWSKQPRLASRKFIVISSSRSFQVICPQPVVLVRRGLGRPQIAVRRENPVPSHGLLETTVSVWGLLLMLQALKHGRRTGVGT